MKTPIYQYYNSAPFLIFWILLLTSLNGVTGHCCFDCSIYIYYEKLIEKYRIDFGRSLTLSTLIRKLRVGSRFYMLASHCPEIDTRWTHGKGNVQIRLWSENHRAIRESILSHRMTAGGVSQAPAATSWAVAKSLACQKIAEGPCEGTFSCVHFAFVRPS